MKEKERILQNTEEDQAWADWLAPTRRNFIIGMGGAGLTAAGLKIFPNTKPTLKLEI